uniref:Uncharacterized protein n=1 Tax=Angiostrongylus cantonensis TaxID=6313 RepID=A0A0K0DIJ6_ANGCA
MERCVSTRTAASQKWSTIVRALDFCKKACTSQNAAPTPNAVPARTAASDTERPARPGSARGKELPDRHLRGQLRASINSSRRRSSSILCCFFDHRHSYSFSSKGYGCSQVKRCVSPEISCEVSSEEPKTVTRN